MNVSSGAPRFPGSGGTAEAMRAEEFRRDLFHYEPGASPITIYLLPQTPNAC